MLRVFDRNQKNIGVFHNYDALLGFIAALENQKVLADHPSFGLGYWAFAQYSPEKLKHVCAWIKPGFLTTTQLKALEQELGLIEVYRGNSAIIQEIPVTSDIDIEELKKEFCLDYCRQHKWRLIETINNKSSPHHSAEEEYYVVHPHTRKTRLSQLNLNNVKGVRLKAELDCCIERLRQKHLAANSISTPTQTPAQKKEF